MDPQSDIRDVEARLQTAHRLCSDQRPTLLAYDANAIQAFIAASSALPYLRGASKRVMDFDEEQDRRSGTLFAGGGRGLLLLPGDEAERLVEELPRRYRALTHGSLAVATAPLGSDENASLAWLRVRLGLAKDAAPPPEPPERAREMCDDCGVRPVLHKRHRGDQEVNVCRLCHEVINRGHSAAAGQDETGRTLSDLSRLNRIAVLSADGNEMGKLFASLRTLRAQAVVSRAVSRLFDEARIYALAQSGVGEQGQVSPVAGGDDVVVFFGPEYAFDVVGHLVERLESQVDALADRLGLDPKPADAFRNIGLGIGLLIGPDHFPASRLLAGAHALEKSAKRKCRGEQRYRSAIDIAYLRSGDELLNTDADDRPSRIGLSQRGASTGHWQRLRARAEALQAVPTSQRAVFRARARQRDAETVNLFRYQLAREQAWRGYLQAAGGQWARREDAETHLPSTHELDMADLVHLIRKAKEAQQ